MRDASIRPGVFNEWGTLREVVIGIEDETVEPEYIPALVWLDETGKQFTRERGGKRTALPHGRGPSRSLDQRGVRPQRRGGPERILPGS
jgi:hypothetical protein